MPRFTTSDGLSLHYLDQGDGTPVIFLSGLTREARDFRYVTPHLTGIRQILLDYRGRGESDWAEDPMTYTIPTEARDVLELMDHLGMSQAAILGTSRGGLIAMTLAALAKDRLTGVALNDIGPELDPAGLSVILGYIGQPPIWKTHAEAAAARPKVMAGFANVPETRWREEVEAFYDQAPDGLHLRYDPKLRNAVLAASEAPAPDLWPLFDAFADLPLAAIRGANSDLLSAQTLAKMKARRPDMIAAEVPDRGHVPFLDEPEALDALQTWLERLP